MSDITLSPEHLDRLAAKLDELDGQLTRDESALLLAVFRLAGEALAEQLEDEVSGFAVRGAELDLGRAQTGAPLSAGFRDSFHPGGESLTDLGGQAGIGGGIGVKIKW